MPIPKGILGISRPNKPKRKQYPVSVYRPIIGLLYTMIAYTKNAQHTIIRMGRISFKTERTAMDAPNKPAMESQRRLLSALKNEVRVLLLIWLAVSKIYI